MMKNLLSIYPLRSFSPAFVLASFTRTTAPPIGAYCTLLETGACVPSLGTNTPPGLLLPVLSRGGSDGDRQHEVGSMAGRCPTLTRRGYGLSGRRAGGQHEVVPCRACRAWLTAAAAAKALLTNKVFNTP